jgi:site-specific DNA-methyltransferase (adenine-specific)
MKLLPYYKQKNIRLYLGDSLKILPAMPANTFDMIFADPPYHLSNDGFSIHANKKISVNKGEWDKSQGFKKDYEFHESWIKACQRVLKPNGTIWITGTHHSIYKCGFALQRLGFHIINEISWHKPRAKGNLSGRSFKADHETVLWAKKSKSAKHTYHNQKLGTVWSIAAASKEEKKLKRHPTQKPLALLKQIILSSTNKGDLILDPFTGSSTTGVAALSLGRKFIGIDREKQYLDLSIMRIEKYI